MTNHDHTSDNERDDTSENQTETKTDQQTLTGDSAVHPTLARVRELAARTDDGDDAEAVNEMIDAVFMDDPHDGHTLVVDGLTMGDFARINNSLIKYKQELEGVLAFADSAGVSADFMRAEVARLDEIIETVYDQAPPDTEETLRIVSEETGKSVMSTIQEHADEHDDSEPRGYQ